MGYKEVPGGVEAMAHEDGKFRIGLRNLTPDSDRFIYVKDAKGNKVDGWPEFVIRKPFNEPERRILLPEAVLKAHGKIPPHIKCEREDFKSKNGRKNRLSDSSLENVVYVAAQHGDSPYKKPSDPEQVPEPVVEEQTQQQEDAPVTEEVADHGEAISDVAKGSAELTAKRAIEIIEKFDFEELRDLNFYTEDTRDRGPRVTVKEAWESKLEEYEAQ